MGMSHRGLHPFVQGLLKELPKAGDMSPGEKQALARYAASIFQMTIGTIRNERGC